MAQGRDKHNRHNHPKPEFESLPETVLRAKVVSSNELELCATEEGTTLERGDMVVISTRYGRDMARIVGLQNRAKETDLPQIRKIIRKADDQDLEKREALSAKEATAYRVGREKIEKRGLAMKLVSAHYLLDEPKIVFFFTAENRIDFRELVKDLVAQFKTRIELRQIGVRDEARVVGGMAVCGRPYCCHGLTDQLSPVSIKMAKEQNLSLNSLKISGPCGRLLCCLAYEHDHYREEKKLYPAEGSRISHDGVSFKVTDVNIFSKQLKLVGPDGRWIDIPADRFEKSSNDGAWQILPEREESE